MPPICRCPIPASLISIFGSDVSRRPYLAVSLGLNGRVTDIFDTQNTKEFFDMSNTQDNLTGLSDEALDAPEQQALACVLQCLVTSISDAALDAR